MTSRTTKRDALFAVLRANYLLDRGMDDDPADAINQTAYDLINSVFVSVVGDEAADRLAEICTNERWAPSDMNRTAYDTPALDALLARLVTV